jgi:molybdenum-dependent DNA-binding transcriptional regulator ModE
MRYGLVKLISEEKMTIRDAAKRMNINYENAKAIYRTFRM